MKFCCISLLALLSLPLSGCVTNLNPDHIIDLTEDQWIEDPHGVRCEVKEMLIFPDRIEYYLPDCGVTKVVHPKKHPLPRPKPMSAPQWP